MMVAERLSTCLAVKASGLSGGSIEKISWLIFPITVNYEINSNFAFKN